MPGVEEFNSDIKVLGTVNATYVVKENSSNDYFLLGGGGHTLVSGFAPATGSGNYVPYTGAVAPLNMGAYSGTFNGVTIGYQLGAYKGFASNTPFSFLTDSNQAQRLYTGGLLASSNYNDAQYIPVNGIYAAGSIRTSGDLTTRTFWTGNDTLGTFIEGYYPEGIRLQHQNGTGGINSLHIKDVLKFNNNIVWHAGNDGSGSGLDADLLDGKHGSEYVTLDRDNSFNGSNYNFDDEINSLPAGDLEISTTGYWYGLNASYWGTVGAHPEMNTGFTISHKTIYPYNWLQVHFDYRGNIYSRGADGYGVGAWVKFWSQANLKVKDSVDSRIIKPSDLSPFHHQTGFTSWNNDNGGTYADFIHFGGYWDSGGGSQNLISFSKNGFGLRQWQGSSQDSNNYSSFVDYWHSGNFNPVNYYTKNESLDLFVGLTGVQIIYNTKTFDESPVVPPGTLAGHAVNLEQLNSKTPDLSKKRNYFLRTGTYAESIQRIYFPSNTISDVIIRVNSSYNAAGAIGIIEMQLVYGSNTGPAWAAFFKCTDVFGWIKDNFYIEPVLYHDTLKDRNYVNVHKYASAHNSYFIDVEINSLSPLNDDSVFFEEDITTPVINAINTTDYVDLTSNQNVSGVKTFTSSPVVPPATLDGHALNFGQANANYLKLQSWGSFNNGSGTGATNALQNTFWFDYNWAGQGLPGSVINFSGLNGQYATEIFGRYNDSNYIAIRTRNGDTGNWNPVRWLWHDGNFNPTTKSDVGHGHNKSEVGLGNVDNTADAVKNVAYATNSTRLYSSDPNYGYGSGAPYYGSLNWTGVRWRFQVTPGTPAEVEVAYADVAGNSNMLGGVAASGYATSGHGHAISDVTGLQNALNGKVDDSQVLTNVPAGAVFTDTIYNEGNGLELNGTTFSIKQDVLADIASGVQAHNWGNHAAVGYLTGFTEADPTVPAWVKSITQGNIAEWQGKVNRHGDTMTGGLNINPGTTQATHEFKTDGVGGRNDIYLRSDNGSVVHRASVEDSGLYTWTLGPNVGMSNGTGYDYLHLPASNSKFRVGFYGDQLPAYMSAISGSGYFGGDIYSVGHSRSDSGFIHQGYYDPNALLTSDGGIAGVEVDIVNINSELRIQPLEITSTGNLIDCAIYKHKLVYIRVKEGNKIVLRNVENGQRFIFFNIDDSNASEIEIESNLVGTLYPYNKISLYFTNEGEYLFYDRAEIYIGGF